jgi:hypothetical protein
MTSSAIDTKLLGKPNKYGGMRADWPSWKYVFKAYVGAVNVLMLERLEASEGTVGPITLVGIGQESKQEAMTLSFILAQTLQGPPLHMLMNVEAYNGFEAWRRLVKKEEPALGSAQISQLTAIMRYSFSVKMESWEDEVQRLEGMIILYERTHSEVLADSLKQALLKLNAPAQIKAHVEMQTFTTSVELREALSGYVALRQASAPPGLQEAVPMDVGAFGKGGKGKEQPGLKGGGKGGKGKRKEGQERRR